MDDQELSNNIDRIGDAVSEMKQNSERSIAEIREQLEQEKKSNMDLERRLNRLSVTGGAGGEDPRLKEAKAKLTQFLRDGTVEGKALTRGTDPQGGYLVEDPLSGTLTDQLINISPIRRVATSIQVGQGVGDMAFPLGRRGATSAWMGEEQTRTATQTPTVGLIRPLGGEIMAYAKVTQWLLDASVFDVEQWLRNNILDEFAYQEGVAFISGSGINRPTGFLTAAGVPTTDSDSTRQLGVLKYVASGGASDFAASNPSDKLIEMTLDLSDPYRQGAVWVMNSLTSSKIRKFKDGQGNYLWQPNAQAEQPQQLLGYPVVYAEDMPNVGSNTFPIAFGNFRKGYLIVDKLGTRAVRDPITEPGFVKVYMFRRIYGSLWDSNAIRLMKIATS